MLHIAICDKSAYYLENIYYKVQKLTETIDDCEIFKSNDTDEILLLNEKKEIDLLLIDIELNGISGFEVVQKMRRFHEKLIVIFITDYERYVYEAIKYHPFRFIRKSHLEELDEAIMCALTELKIKRKKFIFKMKDSYIFSVNIMEVVYFESQHNDVKLITRNHEYKFRSTLKAVEDELQDFGFVRIHSGFLVNIRYVNLIEKSEVQIHLSNSKISLPISRGRKQNLVHEYNRFHTLEY